MVETLKDVGAHGRSGTGHYEASVEDDGTVEIKTIFDGPAKQPHTVTLKPNEWERLVAWVEWRRKDSTP